MFFLFYPLPTVLAQTNTVEDWSDGYEIMLIKLPAGHIIGSSYGIVLEN